MLAAMFGALALYVQATASGRTPGEEATLTWAVAEIDDKGWQYGRITENSYIMYRSETPSGAAPRAWLRTEFREPQVFEGVAYRTRLHAYQLDCKELRIRGVQAVRYAQNNMRGPSTATHVEGTWAYAPPGSIAETMLQHGCKPNGSPGSP